MHRATVEYCGWTKKRFTPSVGGKHIYVSYDVWPLGGMVYGSLAKYPQGRDVA
jgi:hypothetical protein